MITEILLMAEKLIFEGWISILAALTANHRTIEIVYLQGNKRTRQFVLLEQQARKQGVPVLRVRETEIAALATGKSHGGAVAVVGPRRYQSLEELGQGVANPFIVMLDGLEDPFNFGQAIRALYAAGAHGLVISARNWAAAAGIVARASAGASELMPTALVEAAMQAVEHFKQRGLLVACTAGQGQTTPIYQADLTQPIFIIVGGEKRGITRSLLTQADLILQVPYKRDFKQSLGATSSAAILAFEVLRQRKYGPP
jgi:23S rRNA (guanosine2251-2'-O)-methyltransferase